MKVLSVVMPVYNEVDNIREIHARVRAVGIVKEIVLVDDGSRTERARSSAECRTTPQRSCCTSGTWERVRLCVPASVT